MASGRVGGTKALISGKVGNEVYQIRQNSDGTYGQVVQPYVEKQPPTKTVRLAVQQMCTAMVESMMKDLKEVGKISFQSGANKSKSLNAFSSYNLLKLAQDCKANWWDSTQFCYPQKGNSIKLGGAFIMSAGSLNFNSFENIGSPDANGTPFSYTVDRVFSGSFLVFRIPAVNCTIEQFMQANRLVYSSVVVHVNYWDDQEDYEGRYDYNIITLNPKIRPSMVATPENLDSLFVCKANHDAFKYYNSSTSAFLVGNGTTDAVHNREYRCVAGFTIDLRTGRKMISSSVMQSLDRDGFQWMLTAYPCNSVASWLEVPATPPVPYPW